MNDIVLLVARLVLAIVFAVAGVAKLADLAGSREAMRAFGVPPRFAPWAGLGLPLFELLVAVLLIPVATAWWGALGALLLLLAFVGGISFNLARGRTPDCHCFGQLHSAPAGQSTLMRNGILATVAALVVALGYDDSGASVIGWATDISTAGVIGLVLALIGLAVLAGVTWLLVHLLGQNGRLLLRVDALETAFREGGILAPVEIGAQPADPAVPELGLPIGAHAPDFSLSGVYGETMTLGALRAPGKPIMLIFSDPKCAPCNALMPEIGRWQREHASTVTVALIGRGTADVNRPKTVEHGITNLLLQRDREVAEAYLSTPTPTALVIAADGTIGTRVAPGVEAIKQLFAESIGERMPAAPVQAQAHNGAANGAVQPVPAPPPAVSNLGTPAPPIALENLAGETVKLTDFAGTKTLVVFWNPGCGFCSRMVDDIKALEADPPDGAPKLLFVSTGTVEDNQAQGMTSTILLDQGFSIGTSFGTNGTPSAVLVDEQGNIASGVAVGAPGVLALARGGQPTAAGPTVPAAPTPKIGDNAPVVKLPDLNGKIVDLATHRGTKTLLLFWRPSCGYCGQMLEDLKAWEAKPAKGAPKLLVVSSGSVEENKAMGLRSPVLLDEAFSVGNAFGANGTPSAVLIDARGNIASDIAAGADAVFTLAGRKTQPVKPAIV